MISIRGGGQGGRGYGDRGCGIGGRGCGIGDRGGREAGVEGAGRGAIVGGGLENWRAKLLFFTRKFIKMIHNDTL